VLNGPPCINKVLPLPLPLPFLDESYLVVLRRLRTQLISHLYAPNWSMPVVHGTLTRLDKIEMVQCRAARFVC